MHCTSAGSLIRRFILLTALFSAFCASALEPLRWNRAEKLLPGVLHVALALDQPRLMKVHVVRVDLHQPGLRATATGRDKDWGKPMPDFPERLIRTKRIRTKDFMAEFNRPKKSGGSGNLMIVAANAAPWVPWTDPYNHQYGDPAGTNVLNGEIVSRWDPGYHAEFVVLKNGALGIVETVPDAAIPNVMVALGGFAIILKDGKNLNSGNNKDLHPRMAYGLSADRRYLYFLTVDGRDPEWSLGANYFELAELLLAAGASDGINMDGGGSTTLCVWDPKKKEPRILNRATKGGSTRLVASNFGLYLQR